VTAAVPLCGFPGTNHRNQSPHLTEFSSTECSLCQLCDVMPVSIYDTIRYNTLYLCAPKSWIDALEQRCLRTLLGVKWY